MPDCWIGELDCWLGAITDAVRFPDIHNGLVAPSSEQGETASNRGGIGNPPFFVTRLQSVGPALDLGSCHKKARRGGGPGDGASQHNDHGHHMQPLFVIKGAE